jgi:hypothetical protein
MKRVEARILIASIREVQELVHALIAAGQDTEAFELLEEQQLKVERLETGTYYTSPNSRRIAETDEGDGQGRISPF